MWLNIKMLGYTSMKLNTEELKRDIVAEYYQGGADRVNSGPVWVRFNRYGANKLLAYVNNEYGTLRVIMYEMIGGTLMCVRTFDKLDDIVADESENLGPYSDPLVRYKCGNIDTYLPDSIAVYGKIYHPIMYMSVPVYVLFYDTFKLIRHGPDDAIEVPYHNLARLFNHRGIVYTIGVDGRQIIVYKLLPTVCLSSTKYGNTHWIYADYTIIGYTNLHNPRILYEFWDEFESDGNYSVFNLSGLNIYWCEHGDDILYHTPTTIGVPLIDIRDQLHIWSAKHVYERLYTIHKFADVVVNVPHNGN